MGDANPEPLDPCAISGSGSVLRGQGAICMPLISELNPCGPNWINPTESNGVETLEIKSGAFLMSFGDACYLIKNVDR